MSLILIPGRRRPATKQQLEELLPAGAIRQTLRLDQVASGFRLEDYDSPPGAMPPVHFMRHLAGVLLAPPDDCALFWREARSERSRQVGSGMMFTTPVGPFQGVRWNGRLQARTLSIEPAAMEAALPEPFIKPPVELRQVYLGECDPVLTHLVEALHCEGQQGYAGGRLFVESLCQTAARYLAHRYGTSPIARPGRAHGLDHTRLTRVLEYIDTHLSDNLSLHTLAAVACLSPYHFGKMFKRSTGATVHSHVVHARLARAKQLLRTSERSLADVAAACGFYDQSQMTAVFRRFVGTTPRLYQRHS